MFQKSPRQFNRVGRLAGAASSVVLLLGLGACQTSGPSDITGALGEKAEAKASADPRRDMETYRERVRANPKDADAALQYAKALRATGQRAQAVIKVIQARLAKAQQERPIGYLVREAPADDVRNLQQLAGHLQAGRSVIVHTSTGDGDGRVAAADSARLFGTALGRVVRSAVGRAGTRRLCVAGGDTSSHVARALGIEAVE